MVLPKKESSYYKFFKPKLLLLILVVGIVGWMGLSYREKNRTVIYVIPPGTSQQLAAGGQAINIPSEIILTVGIRDTLIIENQDDVVHAFGPFTILPHTTLTKRFTTPRTYVNVCTLHPNQEMVVIINPAPWDILH